MAEKRLDYDRSIVVQETPYWCGPAATQVVLNAKGIIVQESTLAAEIGTHRGGTDHVGLIERVLDARAPQAHYTSVYLRNDPPTPAQRDTLWRHLTQSIDAGWGVVMNWWAPDGNKPRGIKGSTSPAYSRGMTKHYVAAMGYDDDYDGRGGRAVWIADSGFHPQGYWITFEQCASLIPPMGYAYADVVPGTPQAPPPVVLGIRYESRGERVRALQRRLNDEPYSTLVADGIFGPATEAAVKEFQRRSGLTPDGIAGAQTLAALHLDFNAPPPPVPEVTDTVHLLSQLMGASVSTQRYAELLPSVSQALRESECLSPARIAMWIAQIGHESVGLKYMEEIADGHQYEGRADLGNTQPGDGRRFKGRGPIQVTGRHNYLELSRWAFGKNLVPSREYFIERPSELASVIYGFLGAIWYWIVARPFINSLCDRNDLDGVTRAINGGLNGLADRRERWNRARGYGDRLLALLHHTTTPGDELVTIQVTRAEWDRAMLLLENIAGTRRESRSPFRKLESSFRDTCAGYAWSADAHGHSGMSVDERARLGDTEAIALLMEVASAVDDPARYPDRQRDAWLADAVLNTLPAEYILRARRDIHIWLEAEEAYR